MLSRGVNIWNNPSQFAVFFGAVTRNFTTSNLGGSEYWPLDSNVPLTANFSITDKISTTSTAAQTLYSGGTAAGKLEVSLTAAGLVQVDVAGSTIFTGVIAVNDGKFNEIVLSRTGTTASLTVNGVSDGSGTMSGTVNFDTLSARTGGTIFFIGVQADIVVVDAGTTVHTWLIDETNPATISDITGSNDSTAVNFTSADSDPFTKSGADWLGVELISGAWTVSGPVVATGKSVIFSAVDTSFIFADIAVNFVAGFTYRSIVDVISLTTGQYITQAIGGVGEIIQNNTNVSTDIIHLIANTNPTFRINRVPGTTLIASVEVSNKRILEGA